MAGDDAGKLQCGRIPTGTERSGPGFTRHNPESVFGETRSGLNDADRSRASDSAE